MQVMVIKSFGKRLGSGERSANGSLPVIEGEPSARLCCRESQQVYTFRVRVQGGKKATFESKLRFCALSTFSFSSSLDSQKRSRHPRKLSQR
jgi:hypothetical protein